MKKSLLFFLLLGIIHVHAQNMDSIWNVWENRSIPDTSRVQALTRFTRNLYRESAPKRTLTLTDSVIQFGHQY